MESKIITKIIVARKQKGYTQKDIATFLNLGTTTYGDIERGRINLKADDLIRLIDKLEIDLSDNDTLNLSKEEENFILKLAEKISNKRNQNKKYNTKQIKVENNTIQTNGSIVFGNIKR